MTQDFSRRALVAAAGALAASPVLAQATAPPVDRRPRSHALIGQRAPDFALPKVGGGTARLSDYRGKTLVVEFWGLWCPDCLLDGPNVAAFARAAALDPRLAFLAIHTRGRFGRYGSVEAYFRTQGWSYPVALDDDSATYKAYQMQWVPGFLVIDRGGVARGFSNDLVAGAGKGVAGFLQEVRAIAAARA